MHVHDVQAAVMTDRTLHPTAQHIILAMCASRGLVDYNEGIYRGSMSDLSTSMNVSVSTVKRHLGSLEGKWIITTKRFGMKPIRRLSIPHEHTGVQNDLKDQNDPGQNDQKGKMHKVQNDPSFSSKMTPPLGQNEPSYKEQTRTEEEDAREAQDFSTDSPEWLQSSIYDFLEQHFGGHDGIIDQTTRLVSWSAHLIVDGVMTRREVLRWVEFKLLELKARTGKSRPSTLGTAVTWTCDDSKARKWIEDARGEKTQVIKTYIPHQDRPEIVADRARYSEITKGMTLEEEIQYLKDSQIPVVHDNEPLMDPEIIAKIMRGGL